MGKLNKVNEKNHKGINSEPERICQNCAWRMALYCRRRSPALTQNGETRFPQIDLFWSCGDFLLAEEARGD